MSPQDRELMQKALEALEDCDEECGELGKRASRFLRKKACEALRARLAEPDDTPYCWVVSGCSTQYTGPHAEDCARDEAKRIGRGGKAFPLYTRPAARTVHPQWRDVVAHAVRELEECDDSTAQAQAADLRKLLDAEPERKMQPLTDEQIDELAAMARLAEPDDEPVAWLHTMDNTEGIEGNEPWCSLSFNAENPFGIPGEDYSETYPVTSEPLYTRPAARTVHPLTDEQIKATARDAQIRFCLKSGGSFEEEFARAIERAHGITGDSHD